ncbi:SWI5-dependent HO expression protein 4 [Friedmanniomyces endolithicus]|uniref:SWI5-dependent HO expression protein 4 n=1 Tax=Friedmanniomyces endolithicus TaxID=329885 RepID=A0AAN6QWD7_9PEZI|nr:SWI5-dependent HO expression protein 4 [Friedmanniomyces endolithicus]KAK0320066.1 SWI5-dependent HO expression protein 4 [Friedmanniomyces endolithicus]KAK0923797.1 SWI5-dependent HO expression protein 4 [Friedmanniomyces endolithicus]KAK0995647.1 SWI5-dependent HO expression protein 4 [Friedmanniomyces endolithicus]KAK0999279.1 SWI5-dependent HO expression protein 4 [Friedmanniomyces endolithicus]
MTSTSGQARIAELLIKADQAVIAGENAKAAGILREASQIDPQDGDVKKRWLALAGHEAGGQSPVEALQKYLETGDADRGDRARLALNQQRQLSTTEVTEAYELLTGSKGALPLVDQLTALLIQRQSSARRLTASRFTSNPTEIFAQLYSIGDESFKALISVVLDASLWPADSGRKTAPQKDVFRLSLATLISANVKNPERAMSAVTHLLAVQPESIKGLIDQDVVDIVLSDLDIRLEATLRRQAMLATSRMLEVTDERGEMFFVEFVKTKVAKDNNDDLILAFSAASAVFPILPQVAAKIFLTEGFVRNLVPNLEKNSDAAAHGKRKSRTLEQAALELLSAACVDKACRDAINKHCSPWLRGLSDEHEGVHKALSSLITAKISGDSVDNVTGKLTQLVVASGDSVQSETEQAIEGLAYISLQPKAKEEIASNNALLRSLVKALKERQAALFGCLTVFANLTAYRSALSEEQKKLAQLKAYANSSNVPERDPLDADKYVTARCKKLLDCDVVAALVAACSGKQQTAALSSANMMLVVGVLLALAKEQKHRAKMAQQGAVKLLLQIRDRNVAIDTAKTSTVEASHITHIAAHALARLLISLNPAHLFSASAPSSSAVSALIPLLSPSTTAGADGGNEQRDLLPTFEALLALTNLASASEDTTARDLLLRDAPIAAIEDLLFSSNTLVQRASAELVCNLMVSHACVAKFADGSGEAKRRLIILTALTDVQDLATRRAAGGALAALTEWDGAVTAVMDVKEGKGVKAVVRMCGDESEEVVHRGLVCLANIVGAPGEIGERSVRMVKEVGVEAMEARLVGMKDEGMRELGEEVIRKLS